MNEKEFETVEAILKYGGGFVQALGHCFQKADRLNFTRLRLTFPDYWEKYERMAEQAKQ
jgi:hypothetical protein